MVLATGYLPVSATAVGAAPRTSAVPASSGTPVTTMTPSQIIASAKKQGRKGFRKRYQRIRKSDALVDLVRASVPAKRVTKYLRFLAALSTGEQVSELVSKTEGKHFKVRMSRSGSVSVKLLEGRGKPRVLNSGPQCWEAWVAWYAWFASVSALCWGAGAVNPGLGIVCALVMGVIGFTLVDFSDACDASSPMAVAQAVGSPRYG